VTSATANWSSTSTSHLRKPSASCVEGRLSERNHDEGAQRDQINASFSIAAVRITSLFTARSLVLLEAEPTHPIAFWGILGKSQIGGWWMEEPWL